MNTKLEQSLYEGIEDPQVEIPAVPEHSPKAEVNA
jgi:hypothetical protein